MDEETRLSADIDSQPLVQAAAAMRPMLRDYHEEIEREQRLPSALVAQLHAAGFYRMVIPRALGGLQVDPLTYLRVVELLAEGAGSVGWNVCNNSIGQLVTLGLPDEGVQEVHGSSPSIIAGTAVQGGGEATPVEGGYRINGHWTFGTGCQESAWMLGSFQILDDGQPRRRPDGAPLFWRGVFPRAEANVVPGSWDVTGLRGTGSFDWKVENVFLPERRTMVHAGVPLDNQWARWPGITYALPSQAWVGPHHSSVITGIARAGIDALLELAVEKMPRGRTGRLCDNPQVQDAAGRADAMLNAGRIYRSAMIAELWNTIAAGRETTLEQRARCRLAAVYAADNARDAMDLVYRHGGSTSFKRETRLAECWRDLHVVGQTATIAPEWYPIGGRAFLGMDPGSRLR
ncbi:acyl-CoA dehydrogenase family protein [Acidisphaera sp. S103]|uniref:acyl-CoA dehydrogenase family protein n=1 Tax=Acidisphaera sp. S103 TaxID=1747223 RepID=UPI00131DEF41|nr:acyl-CoA dehydrogenase family protein [Acidisphaera sp. S103]